MLTDAQTDTLRAMVDRIIPPDDFPGGWDAGVGNYLERQLRRDLAPFDSLYRDGLDTLDAEARQAGGAPFAGMAPDAQDALLARVEAGRVTAPWPVEPARFFRALVEHAAEGFYSDPGNGGNRNGVAWEMIGFEVRG
jgi:hypothetical protein